MMPAHNRDEALEQAAAELAAMVPRGIDYAAAAMQDVWDSYLDDEEATE